MPFSDLQVRVVLDSLSPDPVGALFSPIIVTQTVRGYFLSSNSAAASIFNEMVTLET
jgi:hypothetical protein